MSDNRAFVNGQWHRLDIGPDGSVLVDGVRYITDNLLIDILTSNEYDKMAAEGKAADALGLVWDESNDRYMQADKVLWHLDQVGKRSRNDAEEDSIRLFGLTVKQIFRQERERAFEAGRATGTVEGWADWTNAPPPVDPLREALDEMIRLCGGVGNGTETRRRPIEEWQRLFRLASAARAKL